jgi:hypothetical protein
MRAAIGLALMPLAFCLSCVGCRKEEAETTGPSPGVTRCLQGLERANKATTLKDTSSIYYEECADLFSDVACRDGWRAAARAEPPAQLGIVATVCKKSYCPALGSFAFAICKDDFVSTPESLARDWPPLFDAIVAREAGMSATDVSTALLTLYVNTARKAAESASAAASAGAPPAPSGSAAPAPGPAVPASAASAGAPPTPSAGPAKPAGSAGTPRAKPVTPAPHPSAH